MSVTRPPSDRSKLSGSAMLIALCALLVLVTLAQRRADGEVGAPAPSENTAGEFDYYTLVLSWSPTHCATQEGDEDQQQCARRDGRRYAFVVHGLWPQYERGYPESCRTGRRPFVPEGVIDGMRDIMPSRGLVIHEYKLHGTCSGLDPVAYFQTTRQLFNKLTIPRRFVNPFETQFVSPTDLVDEFVDANAGLKPDMVAVTCGGPGSRLIDIRVCFTKDGNFRACGENETQRPLCRAPSVHVPPVRSTRTGAAQD